MKTRKKTYRKKATALKAARRRNGSAYKVKAGWRVSAKRKRRKSTRRKGRR